MTSRFRQLVESRDSRLSLSQVQDLLTFQGLNYPLGFQTTMQGNTEVVDPDYSFDGLAWSGFRQNGIVYACMEARRKLFSEVVFKFRRLNMKDGAKVTDLWGTTALDLVEKPWPSATTGDLLSRAMQDIDIGGNFFATRRRSRDDGKWRIRRMRPDYVTIVIGSFKDPDLEIGDLDAEVIGYIYHPGGQGSGRDPIFLMANEVMHWAPTPDPMATYRGMSWLTPIVREFLSDTAMIKHKMKFLEQGATPNMIVTLDKDIKKGDFPEWVKTFDSHHAGVMNAYRTIYLGAGAVVTPVGKDFKEMEFAVTQAVGEVRICAAAQVPPVLVGVTEGIRAATYSNYQSAKRFFGDSFLRPMWRDFAANLDALVDVPKGAELWYDDHDIPFLYDDAKDKAKIAQQKASTIKSLIDAGYDAISVRDAVIADDFRLLKHTGLFSVQLLPPGAALVPKVPTQMPMPKPSADPGTGAGTPKTTEPKDSDEAPKEKPSDMPKAGEKIKQNSEDMSEAELAAHYRNEAIKLLIEAARLRQEANLPPMQPPDLHVHFAEGAIRGGDVSVDSPVTIAEGAFRAEAPVTIEPGAIQVDAPVTIEDGAIRAGDTHVDVAAPEVRFDDGSIRVDAPTTIAEGAFRGGDVTVEPPQVEVEYRLVDGAIQVHSPVTIAEGAVKVEAPVTVERQDIDLPDIHVDAQTHIAEGAIRSETPVTVERTEVHVATPDVHVDAPVTVEPAQVDVNVTTPDVHVDARTRVEPAQVHVATPDVSVNLPAIDVDARTTIEPGAVQVTTEPAQVTIEQPDIHVDARTTIEEGAVQAPITVEPADVDVTVEQPERAASRKVTETRFQLDGDGRIVGKTQTETEEPEGE